MRTAIRMLGATAHNPVRLAEVAITPVSAPTKVAMTRRRPSSLDWAGVRSVAITAPTRAKIGNSRFRLCAMAKARVAPTALRVPSWSALLNEALARVHSSVHVNAEVSQLRCLVLGSELGGAL